MGNIARDLKAVPGDDTSLPLHERIRRYILKGIGSGTWPDGARIPSEHELVNLFGVSRMTVNRVMRDLTADGVVTRVQGVGTFTARLTKAQSTLLRTQDISEEIKLRGHQHSCQVFILQKIKGSPEVTERLEIPTNSTIFHSLIVHCENDIPVQLEERFINPVIAPQYLKQDFTTMTTHRHLVGCAALSEIEHIIHAILPNERERTLLKIERSEPCLLLVRRAWSGKIVAGYSRFVYPGKRYALSGRFKAMEDGDASSSTMQRV
jgi:GntR family transcriptional regulator, histidine utilization repressor